MASTQDTKRRKTTKTSPNKLGNYIFGLGAGIFLVGAIILFGTLYPVIKEELRYELRQITISTELQQITPPNTDFSIVIPKIQATAAIIKDVDSHDSKAYQQALTQGVAHAKGTALPGDGQNIFIFSHSSVSFLEATRYNSIFYLLHNLENDDEITIYYQDKPISYTITNKKIVSADAIEYLENSGNKEQLILMTCWPPGTTLKRLLIQAEPSEISSL